MNNTTAASRRRKKRRGDLQVAKQQEISRCPVPGTGRNEVIMKNVATI